VVEQLELFPPLDFVDYSMGTTPKSTRTKWRKTIAPAKENDRLSAPSATDLDDRIAAATQSRNAYHANL
jgi:hypothetical protein